jgi:2-dehydropantoate 2-reductase
VESGKPSELEFMSGSVTRLGRKYGVKTPIHDFIYGCLLPLELKARDLLDKR